MAVKGSICKLFKYIEKYSLDKVGGKVELKPEYAVLFRFI